MAMQSSPHIWTNYISESLCNPSKMCAFFAWIIRLVDSGMLPVFVVFVVALFGNLNVGPSRVSLMLVSNNMSSVLH